MTEYVVSEPTSTGDQGLARIFSRLGWLGVFLQLALLALPLALAAYLVFLAGPNSPALRGTDLSNYLSWGSLLIMLFTTLWFYRYTRLGTQLRDPAKRPSLRSLQNAVWVGVWSGCAGIAFSMLLLLGAALRMLFVLLANPQTGIMIAPSESPGQSISAIDAVTLTALLIMLLAELIVLWLSLWLLFRTSSAHTAEAADPNTA